MAIQGLMGSDIPPWLEEWLLATEKGGIEQEDEGMFKAAPSFESATPNWLQQWLTNQVQTGTLSPQQAANISTQLPQPAFEPFQDYSDGGGDDSPDADPVGESGFMNISNVGPVASVFGKALGVPSVVGMAISAFAEAAQAEEIEANVTLGEDTPVSINRFEAILSTLLPFLNSAEEQLAEQEGLFGELSFNMEPFTVAELAHMVNPNVGHAFAGELGSVQGDAAAGVGAAESVAGVAAALGIDIGPNSTGMSPTGGTDDDGGNAGDGTGDDGSGDASGGCWVAGTQVLMGDNSSKNIEDLSVGDLVMTFPKDDQRWNTPLEPKKITELTVLPETIWWLNDTGVSKEEWVIRDNGEAARVKWLKVGDKLMTANGVVLVKRVEPKGTIEPVFNFMTADNYSYTADSIRTVRGMGVRGENMRPPTPGKTMRECYKYVFKEDLK